MHVDVIDDLSGLARLKDSWEQVYGSDPEAHFYLSWTWFSIWLKKFKNDWFILAAKPDKDAPDYVAFFPLKIETKSTKDGSFYNEIDMGGFPRADYTGFLCDPEFEGEAIPALAGALQALNWTKINLEMFPASEGRRRLFLKAFSKAKFVIEDLKRVTDEGIDNSLYPYAALPGDWEAYLETRLSSNTRQKARRFLKKVDSGEFRIEHADKANFARDLNTLLRFWEVKWGNRKGDRLANILNANRTMMTALFEADSLVLPVFWKGETALCVNALLMDRTKKTLYFVMGGRDETFNSPPPGFILHAHTIRWAIQNGFATYDFLMGNEPYKYMFGAEDRNVKCLSIHTKTNQNLGEKLDKRSLNRVFDQAKELHEKGKRDEAERAYRQILDADPRHNGALDLLARLVAARGDHAQAAKLLRTMLADQPDNHGAWLSLGKTLHAQADTDGAIRSFRRVMELDPQNREVPPLLAELSPVTDRLRTIVGAGPSWAQTDEAPAEFLKKLKRK